MDVRKFFEQFYSEASFECIPEKALVQHDGENVQYVISSFDNLVASLNNEEQHFKKYVVQRTFRTKKSHVPLWGTDAFLIPFNVMMSIFVHCAEVTDTIEMALHFLFRELGLNNNDIYCVHSEEDQELIDMVFNRYVPEKNFICVPNEALLWEAPIKREILHGRYIKLYKRHFTGYILLMDCNIFPYMNGYVVDISHSLFVLDAILLDNNTIYGTSLFKKMCEKSLDIPNISEQYRFLGVFLSATVALLDGGIPDATKKGSSLRKVMKQCYNIFRPSIDQLQELVMDITVALNFYDIHCPMAPAFAAEQWNHEFERIEWTIKKNERHINDFCEKVSTFQDVTTFMVELERLESTFGIDKVYLINLLRDRDKITYADYCTLVQKITPNHPTCAIPVEGNIENVNPDFLRSLFLERI